tara:strand:- start:23466 stop:24101 length:636 start_codon:yes stop_codon:yes gene_type:complete
MISIVDYGMGNLGSILNMFKRIGVDAQIVNTRSDISKSEKLLLPGVGAFDAAMERINSMKFTEILERKVLLEKTPILGICLGMQLLTKKSEEGQLPGLGYISANTIRFDSEPNLKIPHMGWNETEIMKISPLTSGIDQVSSFDNKARFYFVHSYKVLVERQENSILKSKYGTQVFDAGIQEDNIYGVQFHPEKSHRFGFQILKNFAELKSC